jgi:hypothetical protein
MANLESKIENLDLRTTAARDRLVASYGYVAAAINTPSDEKTGAMMYGGAPLVTAIHKQPITAYDIAMSSMRKDAKSNPALSQFMEDMKEVLSDDKALQRYAELYQKYMNKSPLSKIVKLAQSLGVDVDVEALKPYMGKSLEKLTEDIKKYQELDAKGKLKPGQKAEYLILQTNVVNLQAEINEAYQSKIKKGAKKKHDKRLAYLRDPKNRPNITKYLAESDAANKHKGAADEAYKKIDN